jgi:hypothetical protein
MTIKEMHNYILLRWQTRQSNAMSMYQSSEVDVMINAAIEAFIEDKLEEIKRDKQIPLDDLRGLIVKNRAIKTQVPRPRPGTPDGYLAEPNMQYAVLPEDYRHLLNDRSYVWSVEESICDSVCRRTIRNGHIEYINVVPYNGLVDAQCTDLSNLFFAITLLAAPGGNPLTYADREIFNISFFPQVKGLKEESDKYEIINLVLDYLNQFNSDSEAFGASFGNSYNDSFEIEYSNKFNEGNGWFKVYWERYKDMYYENCFIFVTEERDDILEQTLTNANTGGAGYTNGATANLVDIQTGLTIGQADLVVAGGVITGLTNFVTVDGAVFNRCEYIVSISGGTTTAYARLTLNPVPNTTPQQYVIAGASIIPNTDPASPNYVDRFNSNNWGIRLRIQTRRSADLTVPNDLNDPANRPYVQLGRFRAIGYDIPDLCCSYPTDEIEYAYYDNNLVNSQALYYSLKHPSMKPRKSEPISNLADSKLFIYSDGKFIVPEVMIDYIRQPKKVSLKFNHNCDLASSTHRKICDLALVYILNDTANPKLQSTLQLSQLNDQNTQ